MSISVDFRPFIALVLGFLMLATPARAQPEPGNPIHQAPAVAATPASSAASPEVEALLRILQDDARRAELIRALRAAAPEAEGTAPAAPASTEPALLAPNTLGAQLLQGASQRLAGASDQLVAAVRTIADLPAVLSWLSSMVRDPITQSRVLDASWKVILVLGLGLLAEWVAAYFLRRFRDQLDAHAPAKAAGWTRLKRVPLVLGRLGLDLVPIAAFALVSYGLISAVHPLPSTQLVMLTANNAYIASCIIMAAARMLLSPASTHLRLLPVTDETAAYATVWLRRIVVVLITSYAAAEAGLQFGLPWSAYDSTLRMALLLVTLFLVIIILQNRQAVSDLLRAPELAEGDEPTRSRAFFRALRDRVADIWHLVAIAWLIAHWGVWALEIHQGFWRLTRVSVSTILILSLAKLADLALRRVITRAFRITPELSSRYPGLEARANRYLPVLKGSVSLFIGGIALLFLLESWGIEAFSWFGHGKLGNRLISSIVSITLTITLALVIWEGINAAIQRHLERLSRDAKAAQGARVRTLLPMLRTALLAVILIFVVLSILTEIGVNVAPLIAGAGVVGIAVGFGSQRLVQDVITGIFLLFEDAVAVGDVVQLGGLNGVVEHLSIRSIKLRAVDGSLHIIPFSAVTSVTNQTRDFAFAVIDVNVDYREDTDKVAETLRHIASEMREDPRWRPVIRDDLDVMGVDRLGESGVVMRVRLKTEPSQRWAVAREMNRRIKRRFDELGIEIPYPHQKLVLEEKHPAQTINTAPEPPPARI
ncbi:MAG: mechanosensitive ion channel domain-containing protein [Alphaproteobacteria bacterium]|jgi:small-conductance mechanosensitive channel